MEKDYKELSDEVSGIRILDLNTSDDFDGEGFEEMCSELSCCARARYVCGKENRFFEQVYSAYKAGGWPCGWDK